MEHRVSLTYKGSEGHRNRVLNGIKNAGGTYERICDIAKDYISGETLQKIADRYGFTTQCISLKLDTAERLGILSREERARRRMENKRVAIKVADTYHPFKKGLI